MKKVLWIGLLAISLCMYANGKPLSAAESFVEKMKPYAGHVLNSNEIPQVLIGNTAVSDELVSRMGNFYKIYWYFPTAKIRVRSISLPAIDDSEGAWSAKPSAGFCHERGSGGTRCYPKVRIFIKGSTVKIEFGGNRKPRTYTLLPGKHDSK